jgi:hypothetical protein
MPTPQLQSELAKWYHPPVKPVNCGDYGIGTGRVGHPPYAAGLARANNYAISKGLVQPMSSSIFRSLKADAFEAGEVVGEGAFPVLIAGAGGHGLVAATVAAAEGTCH